ncbi:MAG: hypothetical protein HY744_13125 [Deltaproteobacteria bacterium]|nr:hypothetical protein [Deltaproteobacteria bacterium]
MVHFGLNFLTARYRLKHLGWASEKDLAAVSRVSTYPPGGIDRWQEAEALRDFEYFPCPSVPAERRGLLASLVAEAWVKQHLDRRQALELLDAAPDEPLELLTNAVEV